MSLLASAYAVAAAIVIAAPAAAADAPDTSERLREALSACTLPGPGIEARIDRLTGWGWRPGDDPEALLAARIDGAAIAGAPIDADAAAWAESRARAASAVGTTGDLQDWYARDAAWLNVASQAGTGYPTCLLLTRNSRESDLLFDTLDRAGGLANWDFGRRGEMLTTQTAPDGVRWQTDIVLTSADAGQIDPILETPLATTLAVTFVTRPSR